MNKKTLFFVLGVIIVVGASMAYLLLQKDDKSALPTNDSSSVMETKSSSEVQPALKGAYVDYSEELFASTKETKLLFFHASWCPQCRALDDSIKNAELPGGVTIFKVDYDSHQPLRARYGVTIQTTVVKVDGNGNKIAQYVAYDEPTFQSVKQALLP